VITYDITTETLTLPDGSTWHVLSGGARGREVVTRDASGRVLRIRHVAGGSMADGGMRNWTVKAVGGVRGGPIPPGRYTVHPPMRHPRLGPACFLDPDPENDMRGRDDFWIHGPGPRGSDGCLVPLAGGRRGRGIFHLMRNLRLLAPCILVVCG
jgi:hypothetical protein